ncbi:hypothetical protein CDG77_06180 [Nostoc sp. 'Peltigera membranacea cyanobiont' 213]|uniref:hypothetical protein n=1 Tax=Nostoc sp. 'Peltigera membranacea cyanobiont' 213 TaxID=2014530 RepID=UPI000B954483|nr:hypothetical protein [Nostoc sp. 'Peltigera membranacea cyanobiont' 213]OYD98416.1 hypothetical protein CDG77_06180 [Nostoc sp. 'Peltigera membranacea cyanobiont' 213]
MFDDLFNNLKGFIDSKIQEVGNDLQKRFGVPEPAEPFVLIRRFTPADSTVTKGCIAIVGESWQIEAYDDNTQRFLTNSTDPLRNVILFEVAQPDIQECVFACQFNAKAINTEKPIKVSLGWRRTGQWGTWRHFWSTEVLLTEDFQPYEARAYFKKEADAATLQISVQFESSGILEIRDIELLQAPVK